MSIGDTWRRVVDGFKSKVPERVVFGAVVVLFVIAVLAIELPRWWQLPRTALKISVLRSITRYDAFWDNVVSYFEHVRGW